jgi:hypothetical protein
VDYTGCPVIGADQKEKRETKNEKRRKQKEKRKVLNEKRERQLPHASGLRVISLRRNNAASENFRQLGYLLLQSADLFQRHDFGADKQL